MVDIFSNSLSLCYFGHGVDDIHDVHDYSVYDFDNRLSTMGLNYCWRGMAVLVYLHSYLAPAGI